MSPELVEKILRDYYKIKKAFGFMLLARAPSGAL
jgi:hypothetical protein